MTISPDTPFAKHVDGIDDPRYHTTGHRLHDMRMIAFCAFISGAWTSATEDTPWFKEFLEMGNASIGYRDKNIQQSTL